MSDAKEQKKARQLDEDPIILYGSDYFKIDKVKNRIRLPEAGWVDMHTDMKNIKTKDIKWVAVTKRGTEEYIFTGDYDPFEKKEGYDCPLWDGEDFIAVPYSQELMTKFEKLGLL